MFWNVYIIHGIKMLTNKSIMNKSTIFADILCKDLTSESFFSFVENQGMFNINGLNWCRLSLYKNIFRFFYKKFFFWTFNWNNWRSTGNSYNGKSIKSREKCNLISEQIFSCNLIIKVLPFSFLFQLYLAHITRRVT